MSVFFMSKSIAKHQARRSITPCLLAALLSSSYWSAATAQSITVESGQTLTTPQTLNNNNDVLDIKSGGAISTTGNNNDAVSGGANNQTYKNAGTISTSGTSSFGINSGGSGATISNSGTITTSGSNSNAIASSGAGSSIINTGTITAGHNNNRGIFSSGQNSSVINMGTINTLGANGDGMTVSGLNSVVKNMGRITTQENNANGISALFNNSVVYNSGKITTKGLNSFGIYSDGANSKVVNSGTIIANSSDAVRFAFNNDNALILRQGNVIQGGLTFGGGTDTLDVGNGLSLHYTFDKQPENLITNGAPSITQGNTVTVIDPSTFIHTERFVSSIVANSMSGIGNRIHSAHMEDPANQTGTHIWMNAGGSTSQFRTSSPATKATGNVGQISIGGDRDLAGNILGLYGTISKGNLDASRGTQSLDATIISGGLYATLNRFLGFSLNAGHMQFDHERQVLNNLVTGGIQNAAASFNGYFVAPEIRLRATPLQLGNNSIMPTFTGRYLFQHLNSYSESGSSANLTVSSRNLHRFETRTALTATLIETQTMKLALTSGLDAAFSMSKDSTNTSMGTNNVTLTGDRRSEEFGGFMGANFEHILSERAKFTLNTELSSSNTTSLAAKASFGFNAKF